MSGNRMLAVLAVICVVSVIFSTVSLVLILNTIRVQEAQLRQLQGEIGETRGRINEVELALSNLTNRLGNINQSFIDLSRLEETIGHLLNQTPANVYESVYRSVVVIRTPLGQGSGFFYNESTLILTNWHVVESETDIEVEFYNGSRTRASLVGTDAYADVAIIRVTSAPPGARPLSLVDSSELYIGQQVVAVGNPLGLTGSLSSGYISQTNKLIDLEPIVVPVLQLDITIAPGSSGGPLLDLSGDVVGITNAGTAYGFNFAVPSNIIKRVAQSLIEVGEHRHPLVGFRGVELTPETIRDLNILNLDAFQSGLLIWEVIPDSPAAEVGLTGVEETEDQSGRTAYVAHDIILAVDDRLVRTFADWSAYIEEHVSPGQTIALRLWRSGEISSVEITTTFRQPYQG